MVDIDIITVDIHPTHFFQNTMPQKQKIATLSCLMERYLDFQDRIHKAQKE